MSLARSLGRTLVAAQLLSAVLVHTATAAPADVVNTWSTRASQLANAAGMPPLRNPITLALVHLAIYDAVNAIEGGYAPYASRPHVTPGASPEAAVVEAAYRVLLVELPTQLPALDAARTTDLALIPEPGRSQGLAVGAAAAAALLAQRTGDGRNAVVPYTPGSGPGAWVPTPPGFLPAAPSWRASCPSPCAGRPSSGRTGPRGCALGSMPRITGR